MRARHARRPVSRALAAMAALVGLANGPAARADGTTLASSDFTFVMSRLDGSGNFVALDDSERAAFFSQSRCACPTNYGVSLSLTSAGAAKLASSDTLQAQVMIGSDCDNVSATACPSFGSTMTLTSSATATSETLLTSDVFDTLASGVACSALPSSSSYLWAIVRLDGTRLDSEPSLSISLGGSGPTAPTGVAAQTADGGLLVSWKAPSSTSTLVGYQVLCSPGPGSPPTAEYDNCAAAAPSGGSGPFATLDASLVCSGLVSVGTTSVRVKGLSNGTAYQVAVVSIGSDGTSSAASDSAAGTPGPTLGFDDIYKQDGGTGAAGCAVAGASRAGAGALVLVAALLLACRRRRRAAPAVGVLVGVIVLAGGGAARGAVPEDGGDDLPRLGLAVGGDEPRLGASTRGWNLELRFGPYYPDTDSEFASRGQSARPFAEVFGTHKGLLFGLEVDHHLSHRGGTWALGVGAAYYSASAASLAADQTTRTGDETSLRLVPLTALAVYRADLLRTRYGWPLIPYAKLGLGCGLWWLSDTSKASATMGATFGWEAAAGVSLDLSMLDPEAIRTMDQETGVNQLAIFFEVVHAALDGFGSSSVLRVGDTTWIGGLMMEM
ncbi:MAG TPA: MXAN_2562 family outer membrane beta-barrel protein [Polyangia bacterium]|nr:MXAN_2562 family outer membrane beta-barrel protein [Polyangia bacterium]